MAWTGAQIGTLRELLVLLSGIATLIVGLITLNPGIIGTGAGLMTFVAATARKEDPKP